MRETDKKYKDRVRHGGKREELLEKFGVKGKFQCSMCGILGDSYMIVAHHVTGNNKEHDYQILMCRKCHASLHMKLNNPRKRSISKEQVMEALSRYEYLEDMCKFLGITRSYLYKLRKRYMLPDRTSLRGRKNRNIEGLPSV